MTVLLHSRPPSPAGSGRRSVTALHGLDDRGLRQRCAHESVGVADVGEVIHDVFAAIGDADGDAAVRPEPRPVVKTWPREALMTGPVGRTGGAGACSPGASVGMRGSDRLLAVLVVAVKAHGEYRRSAIPALCFQWIPILWCQQVPGPVSGPNQYADSSARRKSPKGGADATRGIGHQRS